jgi:hypothetical protein
MLALILQVVPDFGLHQFPFALAIAGLVLLALGNLIKSL